MALTPEQLAAFAKDRNAGYMNPETGERFSLSSGSYMDPSGMQIGNFNASGMSPELMALAGLSPDSMFMYGSGKPGESYNIMDKAGADTGKTGTYEDDWAGWIDEGMLAMMLAGFGAAAMGAGAGAGGAAGTNGAFLGEGAMSGIPAWDGALSTSLSGAYGPAGLATAAGGGGTAAAGATGAGGGLLGGGAGALGAGSNLLGAGATLLGGALGAQGQESEATRTNEPPSWLKDPYIMKTLDGAMSLFNQQMTPEYQQRWTDLGNQSQGLLAQPMAGNGFSRFFPGR